MQVIYIRRGCRPLPWRTLVLTRKLLQIVSIAWVGLVLAGSLSAQQSLGQPQVPGRQTAAVKHRLATPMLTGSNGSQGTASFMGNFTTITEPPPALFLLQRQPDCSLNFVTANEDDTGSTIGFAITANTPHYERVLHQLASLTTMADVYPHGCAEKTAGISSRIGVYAGMPQQGIAVSAMVVPGAEGNVVRTRVYSSGYTTVTQNFESSVANAGGLSTADLNGDGNSDLVVVNYSAFVSVMIGNPDGSFQTPVSYPTAGNSSAAVVIDDVNGDSKLDLVVVSNTSQGGVAGNQQISVLLGNGDGTFQSAKSFTAPALPGYTGHAPTPIVNLITADLRGIGKNDIICSNGLVLLGNGDGTFTPGATAAFPYTGNSVTQAGPNLASGDLNNDGKLDLAVSSGALVNTWIGNGDGTFTAGASYASILDTGYLTITDLDGDGNADIYIGLADGGIYSGDDSDANLAYALMGNGDGTFQGAPSLPVFYNGANLGDINGDGKPDLIGNNGSSFTPYLNNGNGSFTAGTPLPVPTSFVLGGHTYTESGAGSFFALADINGDGKADLIFTAGVGGLFQYQNQPIYFVALSNGNGSFATPLPAAFSLVASGDFDYEDTLYGLQTADFNGDGHTGLIFTYTAQSYDSVYSQGFAILLGNRDGTFQAPILHTSYSSTTQPSYFLGPQIAAIGDVNNDHKPDLMVIAETSSPNTQLQPNTQMELLLGNGDGTFGKPSVIATATNPTLPINVPAPAILTDLNGDGRLDLICLGDTPAGQGQLAISLGNGDGTFGPPSILNTTDGGGDVIYGDSLAAADFNGDGKVDVAVTSFESSASGIYFGNGDGTITSYNSTSPVDVFNLAVTGWAVAGDFNGDGKPDLLAGDTLLLNISAPATGTLTTTALTASETAITAGASVTLTAAITGAAGSTGVPTGTVTFLDGTTTLGTGTLNSGVASYATTTLATGANSITAVYSGDANFSGSSSSAVTITVNAAPPLISTTTKLSTSVISVAAGSNIILTALVSPASGSTAPTGTVTFLDFTTTLGTGTLSSGSATFSTATLAVGSHSITAQYGGNSSFAASTSGAVTVTISAAVPDFSLSISPGNGTETSAAPATATVTVTPLNGLNAAVGFACSGLPAGVSCSFSPATITPAGAPLTTTVTFSGSTSAMAQPDRGGVPLIFMALAFGGWFLARARKYRRLLRGLSMIVLAVALAWFGGCGGGSSGPMQTSTTSAVTITATSGATAHTTAYSLTSN